MSSPIVASTLQSALLGAFSGILAQGITAYRAEKPIVIDWIPVLQFVLFTIVSTPPNMLWQEFIETTFPAHPAQERSKKSNTAEKSNAADKKTKEAPLSYKNTAIKFVLDQTLGAAVNTLLYSTFIRSLRAATAHAPPTMSFFKAVEWWLAAGAVDFTAVNFHQVWLAAQDEFWPIVRAGWKLWPFVSLINFTLIKSVQGRNLFGAIAGVAWGIYICIATAD